MFGMKKDIKKYLLTFMIMAGTVEPKVSWTQESDKFVYEEINYSYILELYITIIKLKVSLFFKLNIFVMDPCKNYVLNCI